MSLALPSKRPSARTPFENNSMPNRNQVRSQHALAAPTQFFQIPPTPVGDSNTRGFTIPVTPGGPTSTTTTTGKDATSSPVSGYFGLSKNENNINEIPWSAGSSVRSAAARSPMILDMESIPPPSEEFKRQSTVMALNLDGARKRSIGTNAALSKEQNPWDSAPASPPQQQQQQQQQSPITSHNMNGHAGKQGLGNDNPFFGDFQAPQYNSPSTIDKDMGMATQSKNQNPKMPSLSLPVKTKGPVSGEIIRNKEGNSRSATLPDPSKVDGLSLMYGSRLVSLLASSAKELLLLDLRPFPQYAESRIKGSLNLAIPTTLLKRPSFNVAKLMDCLGTASAKEQLSHWKEAKYIIVYDASSQKVADSATASYTVNKFVREGWTGEAFLLSGGFEGFEDQFPQNVEDGKVQDDPKAAKSLSLSAKTGIKMKPSFNCPLPSSKNAANPFFSNIRQNMDLIGGVGEMPIKLPPHTTEEVKNAFPTWLKSVCAEDGPKKLGDKFYKIEKAEQARMQDALNCSVSYDATDHSKQKSHTLAGVEKGTKNRYNNIWPYDHSRVKLKEHSNEDCDYVNASHVFTEFSSRKYIATQGPLPTTFQDFWSVVWDQDVRVIVMLTAEAEGGQLKCHSYWKAGTYGPYVLSSLSERRVTLDPSKTNPALQKQAKKSRPSILKEKLDLEAPSDLDTPHVIMRKFTLSHNTKPFAPLREITQLQYSSWPDFGAPADPANILGLIEQTDAVVRSCASPSRSSTFRGVSGQSYRSERPVLVHCSAGCGRTGTFCATDSVIDMLRHQTEHKMLLREGLVEGSLEDWEKDDSIDLIEKAVNDLRDQRISMVQSLRQYVLCYETVLEWYVRRNIPNEQIEPVPSMPRQMTTSMSMD